MIFPVDAFLILDSGECISAFPDLSTTELGLPALWDLPIYDGPLPKRRIMKSDFKSKQQRETENIIHKCM